MGINIYTNEKDNTLLEKIEGVFQYKKVHFFDALVGYFRASGYFKIEGLYSLLDYLGVTDLLKLSIKINN